MCPSPRSKPNSSPPSHPKVTSILVGHSLESDLKALCSDTALMFPLPRGQLLEPGLAWVAKKWCHHKIQTCGEGEHDPEEDVRACPVSR